MSAKQNEQQNVEHKKEIAKKKSSAEQETTVTEELTAALEEIVEEPKAEKVKGELVTLLDDSNFLIGERHYRLVSDYREGFNAEKLGERYSDVLARYDYIVGDWGYEQLRLKGFFQADNRRAHPDQRIDSLEDYLYEYCNFGCAYFVIERIGGKKEKTTQRRKKKKKHNRAYIDEKKGPVASNRKKPVIKNRKTEPAKTSEKVKKQEQPKQVEKTKTAFTIRKREE
ncbi:YutD family protein [Enterococcus faecium]|uniref:YutD family protein n=1 Tax=Enterococcus faecium TaxID=1352 RepID=UPI000774F6BB|nr:YutD family protein [Enterococcus faecium]KXS07083.1 transcriptional regulator [Enterococcus faecium]MCK6015977.1 YutD family protein [Enterococcus faecium]MCK6054183.1 YutD family protein [Enterococcus faecium]MCM6878751.1 YutD family protein [Enterococcus faecium]MCZ9355778.1 YutD family protein [Enterococcus faecium]